MGETDSTLAAFGEFLRAHRQLARLSQRRLAKLTGLSDSYLSQVERGVYRPSAQAAKALAEALELSPLTFYGKLGLMDEQRSAASTEQAILSDPRLTPEHQEALLLMYRALVKSADESQ